jgi:hypothetical protein
MNCLYNDVQKNIKMKTRIILTTIVLAVVLLNGCHSINHIRPSDQITTQQYSYSDYDQIHTESAFTVYVEFSDTEEKIEIEANDNLHQYIEVKKESGVLKIGFRDHTGITGSATLNAYITTRDVTGFSASGASRFFVDGEISGVNTSVFLSGASSFNGELYVENFHAELSGASVLILKGSADTSGITASGASNIEDYDFNTDYLNINLTGASHASLTVTKKLDVSASGASVLRYKGPGIVNSQNLSGGSQLMKIE